MIMKNSISKVQFGNGRHLFDYFINISSMPVVVEMAINNEAVVGVKRKRSVHSRPDVPVWKKSSLTIDEAAEYCGVGRTKLRELITREDCSFVLYVGSKRLIRREKLDEYLDRAYSL